MEDLILKGFDASQINQLTKIKELGVDLSNMISPEIDTDLLRDIRVIISNEKYDDKKRKLIANYYIKKSYNIARFIDAGISNQNTMDLLIKMEKEGFGINDFIDPKLTHQNLKLIYTFLKSGNFSVKEYVLKGYDENKINLALSLETVGLNIEELENIGYKSGTKQKVIYEFYKKNVKILEIITPSFSDKQLKALLEIYDLGVDLKKVAIKDYSSATMKVIASGLLKGIDITSYFKDNKTSGMAQTILSALERDINPELFTGIENATLLSTTYSLLKLNIETKVDLSKFPEQNLKALHKILSSKKVDKIKVDVLLDPLLSDNQLYAIASFMENDLDYKLLTLHGLTNRQVKILSDVLPKHNLDGLVDAYTQPNVIEAMTLLLNSGYEIKRKA